LVAPLHGRLFLTGEPIHAELAELLVDHLLDGAAAHARDP
jgi:hypothetical protein